MTITCTISTIDEDNPCHPQMWLTHCCLETRHFAPRSADLIESRITPATRFTDIPAPMRHPTTHHFALSILPRCTATPGRHTEHLCCPLKPTFRLMDVDSCKSKVYLRTIGTLLTVLIWLFGYPGLVWRHTNCKMRRCHSWIQFLNSMPKCRTEERSNLKKERLDWERSECWKHPVASVDNCL